MAKFEEINNLYQETAARVISSPEEWLKFVGTASNLYRYPFEDQLIIYAQRPDARQCAPMDYWNKNMRCYVNKGAKGIALLDRQARGNKLRYVFDMSDVHKVSDRSIMPYQWELSDDWKATVCYELERKYMRTEIPYESMDFEDRIIQIADQIATDMLPEFEESIQGKLENTALSEIYEENRGEILQDALSASIASMLLTRCGVDPEECVDRLTGLQYISMFNTIDTLSELGILTSNLTKPVLIDIEKEISRLERINFVENTVDAEYNRDKANEERGEENGNRIRTERGLSDPELESERSTGGDRGDREVRTASGEVSEGIQGGDLRSVSDDRGLVGTSDNDRSTGERAQGSDNRADEESRGSESANAGGEFRSVSSESADNRTGSGENSLGGNDLRLEPEEAEKRIVILTDKQIEREADPKRVYITVPEDQPFSQYMNIARRMSPDEIHVDSVLAATVPDYNRLREENERIGIPTRTRIIVTDINNTVDISVPEPTYEQMSLFPSVEEQIESAEAAENEVTAAFSVAEIRGDIERAVRNHDTIFVAQAEVPQNEDMLYPVANANAPELFFNERIEYFGGTMLLMGDTKAGKDFGLYSFRKPDEDPERVAKEICDYLESHKMTVTGIVAAEDLEKHNYVFRSYAGVSVTDPVVAEETISAHSLEEAQEIGERMADGRYFTVNAAYEVEQEQPTLRAEALSVGDIVELPTTSMVDRDGYTIVGHDASYDKAELSVGEEIIADMDISELAQKFAKSALAYDELDSLGYAFNGWQGEQHPMFTESSLFGKNLHGDELINLAYRFRDGFTKGTDEEFRFDRDLVLGILGEKGGASIDGVGTDYEVRNGQFVISRGDVSREVSLQMVSNAILRMAKEEYERNIEPEQEADKAEEQGTFRIYQMKDGEEYHYAHFQNMDTLESEGIKLNHEDYNLVYEGKLSDISGSGNMEKLERIFESFGNSPFEERPADFTGHSISVSDVITFDRGNGEEPHFVDSWGFKDFPAFLQEKEVVAEVQNAEVPLPNVRVEWSESNLFEGGKTYTVAEYDKIMHDADLSRHAKAQELIDKYGSFSAWLDSDDQTELAGYDKTKITVNFKDGTSTVLRQDLGDGIGGLLEFLAPYDQFADKMPELREAAGREEDKTPYQLVIHFKQSVERQGVLPYETRLAYRTAEEAERAGKEFLKPPSMVYDGFGVFNLESGEVVRSVGSFEPEIPVNNGVLGEDFKEKYAAVLEADAAELESLNDFVENAAGQSKTNPYELLSLAIGDHLVDDKGVLWTVTNNGNFLLSIEKAKENMVDTLMSSRSFTNWQNRVKENGNIDDFDHFRKITVEEYQAEQGSQKIPGNLQDTAKLEEQIGLLKDENTGYRSLIGRDDVSASEKAEYRSKLTANLNEIERLGGIIANERIRVSEQAEEVVPEADRWHIVHEADDDNGQPAEWSTQLYDGSFAWIDKEEDGYAVYDTAETDRKPLETFSTLEEAKQYAVDTLDVDPARVRQKLEEAGIVNGEVVDEEKLANNAFIQQVERDAAAISGQEQEEEFDDFEISAADLHDYQHGNEEVAPQLKPGNFHITDYDLGKGGAKEKFRRNVEAIKTLQKIEEEDRVATPEEQQILSQYIGWGGLSDAFDERKANWNREFNELKELLSPEEYLAARNSTRDSFYTSPEVIEGIYGALDRMGFKKGNILEPSMGVGNFFGMLPETMQDSKLYGVELDSISGRIAQKLYPDANIQITGYQDTGFDNNSFDVAVGNVPFDSYVPFDRDYSKQRFMLHDYFFAKTLDKVRPGGVIAFVTSKGTMDKEDPKVRKYIAQRAELLGAIRLPGGKDGAFKDNAGTEVTSDILFLQKRDGIADVDPDWVHLGTDENGIAMNQYFVDHPEQVVGHMAMVSGRFGMETACLADTDKPFREQYNAALSGINGKYTAVERIQKEEQEQDETLLPSPDDKNFSYVIRNDKVYYRENTALVLQKLKGDNEDRIKGMVEIRDLTQNLLNIQLTDATDDEIAAAQAKLNNAYDSFVKKHGRIDSDRNKRAFSNDNSYSLIRALEKYDDNGEFKGKADLFTKRTIQRAVAVTSVETASEALSVCLNEKAAVDIEFMAKLCHKPENEVIEDLQGIIFKNPLTDRFETSDEYLSGNVRNKLAVARSYAEQNPEFLVNVAALESVQPKDLSAGDIDVRLGATWIDPQYIKDFMKEVLDTSWYDLKYGTIDCKFNDITAKWWIEGKTKDSRNVKVNDVYGTPRINAYEILEDTLNLKTCEVHDTYIDDDGKKKSKVNKEATIVAQQKQDALKEAFQSWIFSDPERRETLVKKYNELFNSTRPREFNGDYITLPGSNPNITLKKHQKDSVARIISGDNTLLAHCVGAGKTFTMVAGAMESKRLGLCKKSMFVVPNHLTEQWGSEFRTLYPNANILVATKKDFEPANRKKFISRIATGNYDAVIIGHTQFEKIPVSKEREAAFIQAEIDEALAAKEALDERADRHTIKDIVGFVKKRQEKLEAALNSKVRDDVVTFEQLGVDRLFVDESHNFKNLQMTTKMSRIAGVQTSDAQKSNDLLMKCRYMDEITDGKGITFATGTPISNSMTELYTNMRYLQMAKLKELGLNHFDKWASSFGETVTAMEVSPEGQNYRAKTRFAKFFNLPELMSIFKEAADVRTADMLKLPVPEAEYVDVVLEKSPEQEQILESIGERAEIIRNGGVDPSVDNMLKITNDGRKMALDQRLFSEFMPDNPNSKAAACAENVAQIYRDTMAEKSTQLIFCDLGTPSSKGEDDKFNVYDDIKKKLVEKGIPENEVAFIHDCDKGSNPDKKKDELFAKVRSGKVRVLIGSTQKLGAGTNIQDRLIALHHMDVPWRPADLEQQEGRILRQGNQNSKVKIFRYITKGTFDTYNWQTIEKKQTFIGQIMTSKSPVRSHDDVDDATLKYAEVKALASDNPLIAEKMTLEVDVQKLRVAKSAHTNQIYAMQDNIAKHYPAQIAQDKERIKCFKEDIATHNANKPADKDSFSITIGNRTFVDKKEGAEMLQAVIRNNAKFMGDHEKIGSYRGFDVCMRFDLLTKKFDLKLVGETAHYVSDVGHDAFGTITKMNNVLDNMPHALENIVQRLENTEKQLETAKAEVTKPFAKEAELAEKQQRLSEVDALLKMDEKDAPIITDDEEKSVPTESCKGENDVVINAEQEAEQPTGQEIVPKEKQPEELFVVAYRDSTGKPNLAYVECDSKEKAENYIRSAVPGSTVFRARPFEKNSIPEGKEVINIAKEAEKTAAPKKKRDSMEL